MILAARRGFTSPASPVAAYLSLTTKTPDGGSAATGAGTEDNLPGVPADNRKRTCRNGIYRQ